MIGHALVWIVAAVILIIGLGAVFRPRSRRDEPAVRLASVIIVPRNARQSLSLDKHLGLVSEAQARTRRSLELLRVERLARERGEDHGLRGEDVRGEVISIATAKRA
jgi:flagellar biosynthesis/type III secretory pathway M-ring protein FliF/YscJ